MTVSKHGTRDTSRREDKHGKNKLRVRRRLEALTLRAAARREQIHGELVII